MANRCAVASARLRIGKVHQVERIRHFGTEHQRLLLGDPEVTVNSQIYVLQARAIQDAAAGCPVEAVTGLRLAGERFDVEPLVYYLVAGTVRIEEGISDQIRGRYCCHRNCGRCRP